jgi:hypothetical protein
MIVSLARPQIVPKLFLTFLAQRRHELWNAALVDILKYEREYEAHELRLLDRSDNQMSLGLSVDTDATLYDHPLTLVIPDSSVKAVAQRIGDEHVELTATAGEKGCRADLRPIDCRIIIDY